MYEVPLDKLEHRDSKRHMQNLTMVPRDPFNRNNASFPAFLVSENTLYVPRWYGFTHFGPATVDATQPGMPILDYEAQFCGTLLDHQKPAIDAVWQDWGRARQAARGGIVVMGCGQGKTVCALNLISRLRRRTLVLCHTSLLINQWKERARTFLPNARLGEIRQARTDIDADVVVASLQSVALRDYDPDVFSLFGVLVIDEAHHIAAPCLSKALSKLAMRFVLALSATPDRRDCLNLTNSIGPILFRAPRPVENVLVSRLIYTNRAKPQDVMGKDRKPQFARILNMLADDTQRTDIVAAHVYEYLQRDRQVLVLSDRINQLEAFRASVVKLGHPEQKSAYYIGRSTQSERDNAYHAQLLLSTSAMAREGLDCARLDTICMLSPLSGSVEQAVGRILRPNTNKQTPLVLDVVDPYQQFTHMSIKRLRFYQKSMYEVQDIHWDSPVTEARNFK